MAQWKRYPFTASSFSFCFHENLPLPPLPASSSTSLFTTLPNAAFYPRKTSKRLKLPGLHPNFCHISIVRQHTKYKDYQPVQKCKDVNISVYCSSRTTACYCYMQLDYSYVNTGHSLLFNQIFVQHWELKVEHIFSTLTPLPDSGIK